MSPDRVFIIAEAGVNHNGDLALAMKLVEAASACGADAIKFQTFSADAVVTRAGEKAPYQKISTDAEESQYDMIRRLELPHDWHQQLKMHSERIGIEFISTPFDQASADFLCGQVGVRRLKISSGDITNGPFLLHVARLGLPIILSTGMSMLSEVGEALTVLAHGIMGRNGYPEHCANPSDEERKALRNTVTLLQCTTQYPTPPADVNLQVMATLADSFGLSVGLSDHTIGIAVPIAAAGLGATIIEKHFTLDRGLPGPDHAASLEVDEFSQMVSGIRAVEEALGSSEKWPTPSELENLKIVRRSLVAARPIKKGEPFSTDNVTAKRPGYGLSPMCFWKIIGRQAHRDFAVDEAISL